MSIDVDPPLPGCIAYRSSSSSSSSSLLLSLFIFFIIFVFPYFWILPDLKHSNANRRSPIVNPPWSSIADKPRSLNNIHNLWTRVRVLAKINNPPYSDEGAGGGSALIGSSELSLFCYNDFDFPYSLLLAIKKATASLSLSPSTNTTSYVSVETIPKWRGSINAVLNNRNINININKRISILCIFCC